MTATVAQAILYEIARDGFSLGEHRQVDVLAGELAYHSEATNPKTGETWSVNAPTAYEAASELARQIGWDLSE